MKTIKEISSSKGGKKIVMLTAYEYITAAMLEKAGADIILVGDSLGMVFCGYENTLPVTVDDIIYHAKAVRRGAKNTFITADMPFMSYQASKLQALKNSGRIIKESGADAVKLEGGAEISGTVRALTAAGIPVMGHIGMQPQSVKSYGGYPVRASSPQGADKLVKDAVALEKAGVFAIVIEKTPAKAAEAAAKAVKVPVIGIGAGRGCDGQVLVTQDMLGLFEGFTPKFVKKYCGLNAAALKGTAAFIKDVRAGKFPSKKHSF